MHRNGAFSAAGAQNINTETITRAKKEKMGEGIPREKTTTIYTESEIVAVISFYTTHFNRLQQGVGGAVFAGGVATVSFPGGRVDVLMKSHAMTFLAGQ